MLYCIPRIGSRWKVGVCFLMLLAISCLLAAVESMAQCVSCPQWFIDQCHQAGYDVTISGDQCLCGDTPIIIDTTGQGYRLSSPDDGVYFDLKADGTPRRFSWPQSGSGNGFLVLDRNHNGQIDDGREMFGNVAPQPKRKEPNGFLALAEHDRVENGGNEDGIIDSKDAAYYLLRVWIDKNRNGFSEDRELFTMQELGIRSISLDYKESRRRDQFGNVFRFRSKIAWTEREEIDQWVWDVYLLGNLAGEQRRTADRPGILR